MPTGVPLYLPILALLFVFVVLPTLYIVGTFNALVALRNRIRDSWSDVDTELKRRYELIPNLVATVKGYATHEADVLEHVTELRTRCMANNGPPAVQAVDESLLVEALRKLMVVVEGYPDLKADQHFLELQKELINTEDRIQAARRFFNGNVRDYRIKRESFPGNLVAGFFAFKNEEYFTVDPIVRTAPEVQPSRA